MSLATPYPLRLCAHVCPTEPATEVFNLQPYQDLERRTQPRSTKTVGDFIFLRPTSLISAALWGENPSPDVGVQTAYDLFQYTLARAADKNFLGHRPYNPSKGRYERYYQYQSYAEIAQRRTNLGSGISELVNQGKLGANTNHAGWAAGTWSKNCPEWQIADLSLHAYSRISVPLYDTLGNDSVEYVINHSEIKLVFTTSSHLPGLYRILQKCPTVKAVIVLDGLDEPGAPKFDARIPGQLNRADVLKRWADNLNVQVYDLVEIEELGSLHQHPHIPPRPNDIFTISYTSGTTGRPKGAVHTHVSMTKNIISLCIGQKDHVGWLLASYLPLAHILQRSLEFIAIVLMSPIAYTTGDITLLMEDLQIMQPEMMVTVPRVLNRIYAVIKHQMDLPGLKGSLLKRGIATKLDKLRKTADPTHIFWDKLVFNKIRQVIGGKIKLIITGSAPISPEVLDTLKISLCIPIVEGYGLTEASICVRTLKDDPSASGSVGPVVPGFEIKLMDVPEMNYYSSDQPSPRGEICIKSESSMKEYYKDEEKTRESFTEDGFFLTGDIGSFDDKGRLKIIDRKKNIVKLAQGEYIAIEKLEGAFALCPTILQIYVHADSLRSYLVAIVVPDPLELAKIAHCDPSDRVSLDNAIKDKKINDMILSEIEAASNKAGLKGFERIKAIHLVNDQFTIDNGLLTPTLKVKRNVVRDFYKSTIDNIYDMTDKAATKL
ncbi:hypothetical protein E3Q06_01816 [Wallemia mellicola]|uniref:AMP-dependent synthetase/ligase domain-containing protein n=1 Tax=Wallemia mellicola TaxID=1708541 RepID=A0AB38MWI5_9BASI|nr:hypothetical protein E3Q21_01907 [Wallemia mellicola]TIB88898.1 hypothetical protein E3Q20_01900 [Wallemia mellicola]TIC24037.1 hypothetical protein E3Q12_01686 [Wallemia mellicola]TIC37881.1 hypothetical protein E3Q09_00492 [Wallemia mellicola]TIC40928.1 hypothetical protein E3Q07_01895 [Wallemia mellicola]